MTTQDAVLRMQRLYPGRTFAVRRSHWHNEGIGNTIEYRVTLFSEGDKDCVGYSGKTLEECLQKLEAEENKEAVA